MDYGKLLSRSWNIVWNNKFLFVLGFLAALGSGTGNNATSNINFRGSGSSDFNLPPGVAESASSFFSYYGPLLLVLFCVLLLLGIALWLVRLAAQAGLISAVSRIDVGEKVTLRNAWSDGWSKLGRMVGLNLLMYGPFIVTWLVVGVILLAMAGAGIYQEVTGGAGVGGLFGALGVFAVCFALLGCLTFPFLIVVTLIYPFAQRGLVLQNLAPVESVRHGWQMLRDNLAEILVLAVLFLVIGFAFGIVLFIIIIPIGAVTLLPVLVPVIRAGSIGVLEAGYFILIGLVLVLVAAAVNSVLTAFRSTAVTLAYEEFLAKGKAA